MELGEMGGPNVDAVGSVQLSPGACVCWKLEGLVRQRATPGEPGVLQMGIDGQIKGYSTSAGEG